MESNNFYINSLDKNASILLDENIYNSIKNLKKTFNQIIIMCIGTDKIIADCLGPLVGHILENKFSLKENIYIYGTLKNPVHSSNIQDYIKFIEKKHNDYIIIAIDASLGSLDKIGYIKTGIGQIKPGSGVNKTLPYIGNIYIKGIIQDKNTPKSLIIQSTSLYNVMLMAEKISEGLIKTLIRI